MTTSDFPIDIQAASPSDAAWYAPGYGERPPAVDDRLAPSENRIEYYDGSEVFAAPSNEPHGKAHSDLAYVLRAHVAADYLSAVDMLTRTDEGSDVAPDVSVYPAARDLETGGRQLQVLAFEVTSEQRLSVATGRSRRLAARGVPRVFCILLKDQRILEWSRETDGWSPLPHDYLIEDRCLSTPLPIAALLNVVKADAAVIRALDAKASPAIADIRAASREEGREEGKAAAILAVLASKHRGAERAARTYRHLQR